MQKISCSHELEETNRSGASDLELSIGTHNNNLSHLDIGADESAFNTIINLLKNNRLKSLKLYKMNMDFEKLEKLGKALEKNSSLQNLEFAGSKLQPEAGKVFAKVLRKNNTLQKLVLTYNELGTEGGLAIINSLPENKTLEKLGLYNNGLDTQVTKGLAELLKKNKISLKNLDLSQNHLDDEAGELLVESLQKNNQLETLELNYNKLNLKTSKAFAKLFEKNKSSLKKLDLRGNNLDDEAGKLLAKSLESNNILEDLDISSNDLGAQSEKAFAQLIKHNTILHKLHFPGDKLTPNAIQEFTKSLKINNSLTDLDLSLGFFSSYSNKRLEERTSMLDRNKTLVKAFKTFFQTIKKEDYERTLTAKKTYEEASLAEERKNEGFMQLPGVASILTAFDHILNLIKAENYFSMASAERKKNEISFDRVLAAAEESATKIIENTVLSNDVKIDMLEKVLHINQSAIKVLKDKDKTRANELREKSLLYLAYSYGLKVRVTEDDDRLLKIYIVTTRPDMVTKDYRKIDVEKEFKKNKTMDFYLDTVARHNSWIKKKGKDGFVPLACSFVNLFGKEQMEDVLTKKREKISEKEDKLDALPKKIDENRKEIAEIDKSLKNLMEELESLKKLHEVDDLGKLLIAVGTDRLKNLAKEKNGLEQWKKSLEKSIKETDSIIEKTKKDIKSMRYSLKKLEYNLLLTNTQDIENLKKTLDTESYDKSAVKLRNLIDEITGIKDRAILIKPYENPKKIPLREIDSILHSFTKELQNVYDEVAGQHSKVHGFRKTDKVIKKAVQTRIHPHLMFAKTWESENKDLQRRTTNKLNEFLKTIKLNSDEACFYLHHLSLKKLEFENIDAIKYDINNLTPQDRKEITEKLTTYLYERSNDEVENKRREAYLNMIGKREPTGNALVDYYVTLLYKKDQTDNKKERKIELGAAKAPIEILKS